MGVARCRVDLIPPPKTYQSATSNVFEVIEVGRKEEEGQDEDKNTSIKLALAYRKTVDSVKYTVSGSFRKGHIQVPNEQDSKKIHKKSTLRLKLVHQS